MSYEEFIDFAFKHYEEGGDAYYECWDKKIFDEYVEKYGQMNKTKALEMFSLYASIEKEITSEIF